jgi:hypothetical protein
MVKITVAGRNLLWYAALASATLAISRSMIPNPESAMCDAEGAMRVVSVLCPLFFSSSKSEQEFVP